MSTSVQSGEIDFGGALQNIANVQNDNPVTDALDDEEASLSGESDSQ